VPAGPELQGHYSESAMGMAARVGLSIALNLWPARGRIVRGFAGPEISERQFFRCAALRARVDGAKASPVATH